MQKTLRLIARLIVARHECTYVRHCKENAPIYMYYVASETPMMSSVIADCPDLAPPNILDKSMPMLVNTVICLFCTFLSKQFIILSVGYKWPHCLNCFPSASSRVDQINSDSLAAQISIALVKRVKRHDCLTFDIGYFIHAHARLMGGSGGVCIDVTFPW